MPKGLQLDANTGELTGTPTTDSLGSSSFNIVAADSQNNFEPQSVSLKVRGTTILTSHFLPETMLSAPYRMQFQAVGNSSPVEWRIAQGDIDLIGLQLNPQTGELSGTPTKAGDFLLSVTAQDQLNRHSREFVLTVKDPGTGLAAGSSETTFARFGKLSTLGLLLVPVLAGFAAYQARRLSALCVLRGVKHS
ncbi:MAG: putative Ig domain-containing protein [Acidobacteria bacterium]|nr:putative Ig domain-containing protein [Acidobacteriota bacterium]